MIFFMITLIISTLFGFHILHLDNKQNNILENSCSLNEENNKTSVSHMITKSLMGKENIEDCTTDEEKKLLTLSRLL